MSKKKKFVIITKDIKGNNEHAYFIEAIDKTQAKRFYYQTYKLKSKKEFIDRIELLENN